MYFIRIFFIFNWNRGSGGGSSTGNSGISNITINYTI